MNSNKDTWNARKYRKWFSKKFLQYLMANVRKTDTDWPPSYCTDVSLLIYLKNKVWPVTFAHRRTKGRHSFVSHRFNTQETWKALRRYSSANCFIFVNETYWVTYVEYVEVDIEKNREDVNRPKLLLYLKYK